MSILINNLGFPRIGERRELKKATEAYWKGEITQRELLAVGATLRKKNWLLQQKLGVDLVPVNDFSFYDQTLDMSCLLGHIPSRFASKSVSDDLDLMFLMARGDSKQVGAKLAACEMTKWFDTNYHYIVPELEKTTNFALKARKIFDEFIEAKNCGVQTKPVLIGPVTYLHLAKWSRGQSGDKLKLLPALTTVYCEILKQLEGLGAGWVQFDEPILALDLPAEYRTAITTTYANFAQTVSKTKLMVASYFGELRENLDTLVNLNVHGIHVDAVRGGKELGQVVKSLPKDKILSVGIVNGRNIWVNNFDDSLKVLRPMADTLQNRVMLAPSCSLIHVPVTLRNETACDAEFKSWLSYAEEKLQEVRFLRNALVGKTDTATLEHNQAAVASRRTSARIHNRSVKERAGNLPRANFQRTSDFNVRKRKQDEKLHMPTFPTTTIGSFPQTKEVRAMRAKFKKGELTAAQYDAYVENEIRAAVDFQTQIGIDMFVHGEFERNDMVEYFGEQLNGFAFTENGWVQSYGSRYVKPPVIFGDISRGEPMTVRWSAFAQSLTAKPMKGMLTGPVTMIQWSFIRDDQPRRDTVMQMALALRDEVADLEHAGVAAIQIDEPAFREGLPLRRADWKEYLDWAVDAFKLSAAVVKDDTQIHTHMCYAEFNDIIASIAAMDADVISIETSRSSLELLTAFRDFKYPNMIGPGVYDVHSPAVPTSEAMAELMVQAAKVIPSSLLWVNPDCGLKTREWKEVKPALENMVLTARALRKEQSSGKAKAEREVELRI